MIFILVYNFRVILNEVEIMKKLLLISFLLGLFLINGCETIDRKSEEIIKKENEKLSQFIGQPESELKIVMGNPDEEIKNDKGVKLLVYEYFFGDCHICEPALSLLR